MHKRGFRITLGLVTLLAALSGSPVAAAASAPTTAALAAAAFIAGHPVAVVCDADVNLSPLPSPPGYPPAIEWTVIGTGPIHMTPTLCSELAQPLSSPSFAHGLFVLIRAASIAGRARSEACASLVGALGVYDVLRQFYGVPFFTSRSWSIGALGQQLALNGLPDAFQPAACRWPG